MWASDLASLEMARWLDGWMGWQVRWSGITRLLFGTMNGKLVGGRAHKQVNKQAFMTVFFGQQNSIILGIKNRSSMCTHDVVGRGGEWRSLHDHVSEAKRIPGPRICSWVHSAFNLATARRLKMILMRRFLLLELTYWWLMEYSVHNSWLSIDSASVACVSRPGSASRTTDGEEQHLVRRETRLETETETGTRTGTWNLTAAPQAFTNSLTPVCSPSLNTTSRGQLPD